MCKLGDKQKKDFEEICRTWGIANTLWDNVKGLEFTSPEPEYVFNAFKIGEKESIIPPDKVKVLIIGQDPYPDQGRADGLAFSFKNKDIPADDSLLNIFKAIKVYQYKEKEKLTKYFCDISDKEISWKTNLKVWAKNGILLLNTALTHENKDAIETHIGAWNDFIQQVIKNLISYKLNNNSKLAVFLWGKNAQKTFLKCLIEKKEENKEFKECLKYFVNKKYPGIKKEDNDQIVFNENSFKLINERDEIAINENIKIYMTSHPSNNYQAVKHGFCCNSPNHFEACDKFLKENIWENFPEK